MKVELVNSLVIYFDMLAVISLENESYEYIRYVSFPLVT